MSEASVAGPEVDAGEDLYRCITTMDWWVAEESRPSSAAFKQPVFSADIVSIAKTPEYTLGRFPAGYGLVLFHCGDARAIGFVPRRELDELFPENEAHANVDNPHGGNKRKTMAQKLAQTVAAKQGVIRVPSFGS